MQVTPHEIRVQEFALAVYRYCISVRGSVTSWIRTVGHNVAVGGVHGSLHVVGLAVDVVLDGPLLSSDERHKLASDLGIKLVIESDHDHLQAR